MPKQDQGQIGILRPHCLGYAMHVLHKAVGTAAADRKAKCIGMLRRVSVPDVIVTEHQKALLRKIRGKHLVAQKILAHSVRDLHHRLGSIRHKTVGGKRRPTVR